MKKRLHVTVKGKVQGVFFRYHTKRKARSLGVGGYVVNKDNGDVEIEAEGTQTRLEALLDWCRSGPPFSKVTGLKHEWKENKDEFHTFSIKY